MAVTLADLMAPRGPLEPDFFVDADADREARLLEYIARATARVAALVLADPDPAVRAYALYLAFDAVYLQKCNTPATQNLGALGLPSETFIKEQIQTFADRARAWLLEYEGLVAGAAPAPAPDRYSRGTRAVPTRVSLF